METSNQVQVAVAFRAGDLSVSEYISQIESQFEKREPSVLAFLPEENRFERLCKEAEELVARYPDPENRPALFGLLVGIKDIFHADGFVTQAGSRLPPEALQGAQAESVARLKKAGALILGKTVTTEFAYFTPGPTRNPYNFEHTPGGSSSGSAAAVGAGICPFALGTQTIGSVIRPAAFCGVVGFKPTYDRISRNGVIPLSPSLDHVGFFAVDIALARQVASVLVEGWTLRPRPAALYRGGQAHIVPVSVRERDGFEIGKGRPRLGIPEGPYLDSASDYALACFRAICESLADAGYELRRVEIMDDFQAVRDRHDAIMSAEAAQVHESWFEDYGTLYSPKFTELIKRGQEITNYQLQSALQARDTFNSETTQIMAENNIDLWICPSTVGPAPKGLESTGDPVMNLPWTQIGFPAINLPAGKNDAGLPMGLQVAGKRNMDEALLVWAEDLERVVSQR